MESYDSKLGSINWPIEEATWLRFVSKKNELSNGIVMLLNYFEDVNDLKTDSEILKDLAKFQIFLLTTRENSEEFKSETQLIINKSIDFGYDVKSLKNIHGVSPHDFYMEDMDINFEVEACQHEEGHTRHGIFYCDESNCDFAYGSNNE